MAEKNDTSIQERRKLDELRTSLLRLHKVLLDDERAAYEKIFGPIGGSGRVLSLVMSDPFFEWLHRISQLIVRIDEVTEARGKDGNVSEREALDQEQDLISEARALILSSDGETDFTRRYKAVLQRNSHAVMAHAEVLKSIHDD